MRAWEAGDATVDSWGFFLEGLGAGKVCEPVQGRWCWPGTAIHLPPSCPLLVLDRMCPSDRRREAGGPESPPWKGQSLSTPPPRTHT